MIRFRIMSAAAAAAAEPAGAGAVGPGLGLVDLEVPALEVLADEGGDGLEGLVPPGLSTKPKPVLELTSYNNFLFGRGDSRSYDRLGRPLYSSRGSIKGV